MKNIFKKLAIMILTLSLLLAFGCSPDDNTAKTEEEIITSGYVSEKEVDGDDYFITFNIPKTPEGKAEDLRVKTANKEDYEYFVEENYYLFSYEQNSLIIKNFQINNPLGEVVTKSMEQSADDFKGKPIFATEKLATEDYTLLDDYSYDIDEDGTEETIALYTTAQRDANGEIMWDDGQIWVLAVQGSDKDYELYNSYVQLGSISFYVFTADDAFHITTVENTTAGLKLTDYVFDKNEESFVPEIHYDVLGDVIMLYVSR